MPLCCLMPSCSKILLLAEECGTPTSWKEQKALPTYNNILIKSIEKALPYNYSDVPRILLTGQ